MTAHHWTNDRRVQRFEHLPWLFKGEATPAERRAQLAHQRALGKDTGSRFGPRCYVARSAFVGGESGGGLVLGADGFVAAHAYVTGPVRLGDHSTINPFATLRGPITGGAGVRIGAYACLVGFNHGFADPDIPVYRQPCTSRGITLGDDVWIGAHATIVDGVSVGSHVIVAAGAVVTKSVPDYAIVGGNPARVIRLRKPPVSPVAPRRRAPSSLETRLERFGGRVAGQVDALLGRYQTRSRLAGGVAWRNEPGGRLRIRPWCDAVEIAAMFGRVPPGLAPAEWITRLRDFQDPVTGLVPEHAFEDAHHNGPLVPPEDPARAARYNTMALHYALECLGSSLARPVKNAADLRQAPLLRHLALLPWKTNAWGAGDWIDTYATCLLANAVHFRHRPPLAALFNWLDARCDPATGMWGSPTGDKRLLLPVNGFYRLTRGTYAQFGRPLPNPEAAMDVVMTHSGDRAYFTAAEENACNVLDVVHPFWLCLKQTDRRRAEAEAWVVRRLPRVLRAWENDRGFDFQIERRRPSLQGTEMWLSIVWLMADLLGLSNAVGYRPRGVHRPESPGKGLV
jgi:acetyltransferase-like isoleucine patch superfamily enzyme